MAVSSVITLPAQPASGSSVYIPLGGGDGWVSPISAYSVLNQVTMDASGTTATCRINFDARWQNILVYSSGLTTGVAGAQDFQTFLVQQEPSASGHRARGFGTGIQLGINDECVYTWNPPLILNQQRVVISTDNTDGGVLLQFAWIFCFNIRVYEKVPLATILASIPSIAGQNVVL